MTNAIDELDYNNKLSSISKKNVCKKEGMEKRRKQDDL